MLIQTNGGLHSEAPSHRVEIAVNWVDHNEKACAGRIKIEAHEKTIVKNRRQRHSSAKEGKAF